VEEGDRIWRERAGERKYVRCRVVSVIEREIIIINIYVIIYKKIKV